LNGKGTMGAQGVNGVAIFCVPATYTVSTFAGSGTAGSTDAVGKAASFNSPDGLAVDANGNLYVAERTNRIRKITPNGTVSTFAGSGASGSADGVGTAASFNVPRQIAFDASGNLYVADQNNRKIRKITANGTVSTFAGSGASGSADGAGTVATFSLPTGLALDGGGNVYVGDPLAVRKVTPSAVVSTLAPVDNFLGLLPGLAMDGAGNVAVAVPGTVVKKISPAGTVSELAGGVTGDMDGVGTAAQFGTVLLGLAADANGDLYVSDTNNRKIRRITPSGVVTTLAGSGSTGAADGPALSASFNAPVGLVVDASGNVFVSDLNNHKIRKITRD
jgi:serine/threonine protein kinase, bacterial